MPECVGTIAAIYDVPVKSVGGRPFSPKGMLLFSGLMGSRNWVVWDPEKERVVTAKLKEGAPLLDFTAWDGSNGEVWIMSPDGRHIELCGSPGADEMLSKELDMTVQLIRPAVLNRFLPTNYKATFKLRPGMGVDSSPVHFVTSASLRQVGLSINEGILRLRPTIVINTGEAEGFIEDDWAGRALLIGDSVRIQDRKSKERCPEPGQPQRGMPAAPDLLRAMRRVLPGEDKAKMQLGRDAAVVEPGAFGHMDPVYLL